MVWRQWDQIRRFATIWATPESYFESLACWLTLGNCYLSGKHLSTSKSEGSLIFWPKMFRDSWAIFCVNWADLTQWDHVGLLFCVISALILYKFGRLLESQRLHFLSKLGDLIKLLECPKVSSYLVPCGLRPDI